MTCKDCLHVKVCDNLIAHGLPFEDGKYPAEKFCDLYKSSADVVEVVRCKDCIYSEEYTSLEPKGQCMCERKIVRRGIYRSPVMLVVSKDDFCSGGKRKESIDEVT